MFCMTGSKIDSPLKMHTRRVHSIDNAADNQRMVFQMKQKTEITYEIEERIILRASGDKFQAFCPQCQTIVEMLTPPVAAAFSGLSERAIFRLIEAGEIHFVETERVFVCRNSLTQD